MTDRQLLETAVSLMLQVAAVVGFSGLAARRLRSAVARDRLWNACFVALALLAAGDFFLPHLRLIPAPLPTAATDDAMVPGRWVPAAVLAVWACGAALLTLRLVRDFVRLVRLFRSAAPAPDAFVAEVRNRIRSEAAAAASADSNPLVVAGRPVEIAFSESLGSPSCWQLHRPVIVLPASIGRFPPEEAALIVQHELAHLRCLHPLLLFIQRVVEIAFWVHPAVWWAARQADRTREFRCDDEAVASRSSASAYLRAILRLASPDDADRPAAGVALGFGAECPLIVDRAERLASRDWSKPPAPERSRTPVAPIACAVAAMLLLWVPLGTAASRRSTWSPWPAWSASLLHSLGVAARDYEIDGHRLRPEEFHRGRRD